MGGIAEVELLGLALAPATLEVAVFKGWTVAAEQRTVQEEGQSWGQKSLP